MMEQATKGEYLMKCRLVVAVMLIGLAVTAAAAAPLPPYQPVVAPAKVPAYTVKADLSNVVNRAQFGKFTQQQKALLAQQGFFIAPAEHEQLHYTYENNDYLVIPSFVTTDAVLQLYHIFYDYSLRDMEGKYLLPTARQLTQAMLADNLKLYTQFKGSKVGDAALKNVAYFGVAAKALGLKVQIPTEATKLVNEEWKMISAHKGREQSAIFPYEFDYSQFVPRGHYTRSKVLKQYFIAMMWYGLVPLPVQYEGDTGRTVIAYDQMRQSLLMLHGLYEGTANGKPMMDVWQRIYEPTAFYVELSDDLTPNEYRTAAEQVWGHLPQPEELQDQAKLLAFHDAAQKLRPPRIATFRDQGKPVEYIVGVPTQWQFRFMGQRAIPDSIVLQNLVNTNVPGRMWPTGPGCLRRLGLGPRLSPPRPNGRDEVR